MKYTKEHINNFILEHKGCDGCSNCYYYNEQDGCELETEIREYKCNIVKGCRNCDYWCSKNNCRYLYLKEQYDKLELMRKILK